MGELN